MRSVISAFIFVTPLRYLRNKEEGNRVQAALSMEVKIMKASSKIGLLMAAVGAMIGLAACGSQSDTSSSSKTLTLWSDQEIPATVVKSWKESPFHTQLAKQTKIKVNWQFPASGADFSQAFNLLITQKKLPDMIWHGFLGSADQMIS